jgi:hypothetical protein
MYLASGGPDATAQAHPAAERLVERKIGEKAYRNMTYR